MASKIKFVPKCLPKLGLSGHLIIRKPTFDEKYLYLAESGLQLDDSGQPQEVKGAKERIEFIRRVVALSKEHYVEVDLTVDATGEKLASFDDIEFNGDCDELLIEVGMQVMGGFKVGNA
jgi:hypothetical protein